MFTAERENNTLAIYYHRKISVIDEALYPKARKTTGTTNAVTTVLVAYTT